MNLIMQKNTMSKYFIKELGKVHSTNSYALDNFSSFEDRTIVFSKHQTNGRGRYNRHWVSDETENLFITILLKPENIDTFPFSNLTQYLSVIVCNYLEEKFNIDANIKWPNDILVEKAKISGILAEAYTEKNKIKGLVLGFGLNVNMQKETIDNIDQKATSLSILKNENFDVDIIVEEIAERFFEKYEQFVQQGFSYIKNEYLQRCDFLGSNITVKEVNKKTNYKAIDIDEEGLLIVEDEFGSNSKIITGDILWKC